MQARGIMLRSMHPRPAVGALVPTLLSLSPMIHGSCAPLRCPGFVGLARGPGGGGLPSMATDTALPPQLNNTPLDSARYTASAFRKTRANTVVNIVPQAEVWVVERLGRFHRLAEAGLHIIIPIVESIAYVHTVKELAVPLAPQHVYTSDNVGISLTGTLYVQVEDPELASYRVDDPYFAMIQLAQTALRNVIGRMALDDTFQERDQINQSVTKAVGPAALSWGMRVHRYEITDFTPPTHIADAMNRQAVAERKRRERVLDAEGYREAEIKRAEGERMGLILRAEGTAKSTALEAEGRASELRTIGRVLDELPQSAFMALSASIATHYIHAFSHLAGKSNTMVLSEDAGDVTKVLGRAAAIVSEGASMLRHTRLSAGAESEEAAPTPSTPGKGT